MDQCIAVARLMGASELAEQTWLPGGSFSQPNGSIVTGTPVDVTCNLPIGPDFAGSGVAGNLPGECYLASHSPDLTENS
jgi:hypothetical protein